MNSQAEYNKSPSPVSSLMASFRSIKSDEYWSDCDQDNETSPLLPRRSSARRKSCSSTDSFHSCQLSMITDVQVEQPETQGITYGTSEPSTPTENTKVYHNSLGLKGNKGGSLYTNSGHSAFNCITSLGMLKPYLLFTIGVVFSVMIAVKEAQSTTNKLCIISSNSPMYMKCTQAGIVLKMAGPFYSPNNNDEKSSENITVYTTCSQSKEKKYVRNYILSASWAKNATSPIRTEKYTYIGKESSGSCKVHITTMSNKPIPINMAMSNMPLAASLQPWFALVILVFVYLLIILDLTHRATAAMLGGLGTIAALTVLNKGPTLEDVIGWIGDDIETLSLLFGMMIIVSVLAETGFFSYIALKAFQLSQGRTWYLITTLCVLSAVISAFLDNVTTILLLTPVTIRLCEVCNLDPKYVLIAEVLFSNIGGTATAIGDPPNVLIVGNQALEHKGVAFGKLTLHLSFGILLILVAAYLTLRILYHYKRLKNEDPPLIEEMRREADIWQRTASRLCIGSPEEKTVKILLLQKSMMIRNVVAKQLYRKPVEETYTELMKKYQITDIRLLIKTSLVVAVVVILFFIQILDEIHLKIGWIPVLGAIWLILIADVQQLERVVERVEWTTLIFFAALFVMMKGISELGLIDVIGTGVQDLIRGVSQEHRLLVAIITIIWISALVSAFIDNIPFTSAMIPVVMKLTEDPSLGLPLRPMVYALAFGSCLGGNGTLVGASANLVAAGLSEQQGYKISFNTYFKIGFPVMMITVFVAMCYLLVCHVALSWDVGT